MLFKRYTLFRFFGFPVQADLSWALLSILFIWTLSEVYFPASLPGMDTNAYAWMSTAGFFGLLLSILAHETAHAVIAEYYRMPIKAIVLFIFGGVAEMNSDPPSPKAEARMAIAGPIMSLLLGFFFTANSIMGWEWFRSHAVVEVSSFLALVNFLIAGFNIIPAFPLDGGRIYRAWLWKRSDNFVSATRRAAKLGQAFGFLLLGYSAYLITREQFVSGIWWAIVGLMLSAGGSMAVRLSESRSVLSGQPVRRFLHESIMTVAPDMTLNEFMDSYVQKHFFSAFPVVDHGKLRGIIHLEDVLGKERSRWAWMTIGTVMRQVEPDHLVAPDHDCADALETMREKGLTRLFVAEGEALYGIVQRGDLTDFLMVNLALRDGTMPR